MTTQPQPQIPESRASAAWWATRAEAYVELMDVILAKIAQPMAEAEADGRPWDSALPEPEKALTMLSVIAGLARASDALANVSIAMRLSRLKPRGGMPEVKIPPFAPRDGGPGRENPFLN